MGNGGVIKREAFVVISNKLEDEHNYFFGDNIHTSINQRSAYRMYSL